MNWIIDFFQSIFSVISSVIDLVLSYFQFTLDFLANIPVFVNFISGSFVSLPGFIVPFAVYGIGLSIVFLIMGRG